MNKKRTKEKNSGASIEFQILKGSVLEYKIMI